ncbi:MAG: alginate lyase family protein [Myxococcales bacterium]|nr:alginate lyase family protein [Myxococcales bacterium]
MRLERLMTMGPAELAGRSRQALFGALERVSGTDLARPLPDGFVARWCRAARPTARFFLGATDAATPRVLAALLPEARAAILGAAEELLAGRFALLGYRDLDFGRPVDWHLDPVSGQRAPRRHFTRLDPLDVAAVGDVKVTWELSRHQWLVTLAQAYAFEHDERYARSALDHLDAWIESNPPGRGIHWTSSLEIALRLVSWSWVLHLCARSAALEPARRARIVRMLAAHATHAARYLSHYFSPNTHITGEALGLYYAAACLDELPRARRWRAESERILAREIDRQVLPDGAHLELSPSYARYTAEMYLHWLVLAERLGHPVPDGVRAGLVRLLDFLLGVALPDGSMPAMGDADGGSLLPLARRGRDDLRGVFSTAAAVLARPDYAWAARGLQPETLWLLGPAGAERFRALRPAPPATSPARVFRDGGVAVVRDSWRDDAHQLLFDVGPLGCPVSSGHGHADLLAIQGAFFGAPLLVDAGTYTYARGPWRDAFRSSQFHGTVTVDGLSQAEPTGPFAWRERPRARLERWESSPGRVLVSASHGAYRRLADPVEHRRTVRFVAPDRFLVEDVLEGAAEHLVELRFQLAAGARLERRGPWLEITVGDGRGVDLRTAARVPLALALHAGELEPPLGWVSPDYGQRLAAPLVVFSARAQLPLRVVTVLRPRRRPPDATGTGA